MRRHVKKPTLNAIDVTVGSRLRFRRQQLGMSLKDLGIILGRSKLEIELLEIGASRLLPAPMFAICAALDVPVSFFYATIVPSYDP